MLQNLALWQTWQSRRKVTSLNTNIWLLQVQAIRVSRPGARIKIPQPTAQTCRPSSLALSKGRQARCVPLVRTAEAAAKPRLFQVETVGVVRSRSIVGVGVGELTGKDGLFLLAAELFVGDCIPLGSIAIRVVFWDSRWRGRAMSGKCR